MRKIKQNFTIPEDTSERLKAVVPDRKRSAFVAEAIEDKLKRLEQEQLTQALREGYVARRAEAAAINAEWEAATMEGWE